jgi:hypothetical protein
LEADKFFLTLGRRPEQHQHAIAILLHARLLVNAVGPTIDVVVRRQIALLPARILLLPSAVGLEITAGDRLGASAPSSADRSPGNSPLKNRANRAPAAANPGSSSVVPKRGESRR